MWTYIVLVNKWEKHTLKSSSNEFCRSLATWPESWNDSQNLAWHEIVQIPACTSYLAFHGLSTLEPFANFTFFTSLHQTLTLNPYVKSHKIQENDWTKYNQIWHGIKANKNIVVNYNFTQWISISFVWLYMFECDVCVLKLIMIKSKRFLFILFAFGSDLYHPCFSKLSSWFCVKNMFSWCFRNSFRE